MNDDHTLKATISAYLDRRSGVSFVELSRDIDGFHGDLAWGSNETNVVFWTAMSKEAIDAMMQLIREGKIKPTATESTLMVYAFDGGVIDMPIATSVRRKYAKPRWLPTVFSGARRAA